MSRFYDLINYLPNDLINYVFKYVAPSPTAKLIKNIYLHKESEYMNKKYCLTKYDNFSVNALYINQIKRDSIGVDSKMGVMYIFNKPLYTDSWDRKYDKLRKEMKSNNIYFIDGGNSQLGFITKKIKISLFYLFELFNKFIKEEQKYNDMIEQQLNKIREIEEYNEQKLIKKKELKIKKNDLENEEESLRIKKEKIISKNKELKTIMEELEAEEEALRIKKDKIIAKKKELKIKKDKLVNEEEELRIKKDTLKSYEKELKTIHESNEKSENIKADIDKTEQIKKQMYIIRDKKDQKKQDEIYIKFRAEKIIKEEHGLTNKEIFELRERKQKENDEAYERHERGANESVQRGRQYNTSPCRGYTQNFIRFTPVNNSQCDFIDDD